MEPRFFKRGNNPKRVKDTGGKYASMEPRFFKRGNIITALHCCWPDNHASMEPRFFKRGNYFLYRPEFHRGISFNGATFFQTWK